MNNTESRFMRIKRYSQEQVSELHDVERAAELQWNEAPSEPSIRGVGWKVAGAQKMERLDLHLGAYWGERTTSDEKSRSIAKFLDDSCVRKAFIMADDDSKTEMEAMHSADWFVWKSAPNPTNNQAQNQLQKIYENAE